MLAFSYTVENVTCIYSLVFLPGFVERKWAFRCHCEDSMFQGCVEKPKKGIEISGQNETMRNIASVSWILMSLVLSFIKILRHLYFNA